MDLDKKCNELQAELAQSPAQRASTADKDWIPRQPKRVLSGHRDHITSIAFHPIYNVMATASSDFTVKLWDWETGDLERTLKGHTRLVL